MFLQKNSPEYSGGQGSFGFQALRIALALLLLTAATLKLLDRSADLTTSSELLSSAHFQLAFMEVEAFLGFWLLIGVFPQILWWAVLFFFSALGCVSFYQGLAGVPSCGCFGMKLRISPWWAFLLDFVAVGSLARYRPAPLAGIKALFPGLIRPVLGVGMGASAVLGTILLGFLGFFESPQAAFMYLRGESITLAPAFSDLGEARRGEKKTFTLNLRNYSARLIKITGGSVGCDVIATDDLPVTLPPGETTSIKVFWEFRGRPGPFQKNFKLFTDNEIQPLVFGRIKGTLVETPEGGIQ